MLNAGGLFLSIWNFVTIARGRLKEIVDNIEQALRSTAESVLKDALSLAQCLDLICPGLLAIAKAGVA